MNCFLTLCGGPCVPCLLLREFWSRGILLLTPNNRAAAYLCPRRCLHNWRFRSITCPTCSGGGRCSSICSSWSDELAVNLPLNLSRRPTVSSSQGRHDILMPHSLGDVEGSGTFA